MHARVVEDISWDATLGTIAQSRFRRLGMHTRAEDTPEAVE